MQKLRSALLGLLDIVGLDATAAAHGAVTFILLYVFRVFELKSVVATLLAVGLVSAQICIATARVTWSAERFAYRVSQLAWQMTWFYLLILLLESFEKRRHTLMLFCLPITIAPFVLATWLPVAISRLFAWRLVNTATPQTETPPSRMQFHLADVWCWITLLCLLFAVIPCFRNPTQGGFLELYFYLFGLGLLACVPAGLTVSVLFWLVLGERWSVTRWVVAGLLTFAWLITVSLIRPLDSFSLKRGDESAVWFVIVVIPVVTLATTIMLRLKSWRLMRTEQFRQTERSE